MGVAGTVQSDVVTIGDVAEELPLGPRQRELNSWTPADTKRAIEQLIESTLSSFVVIRAWACQPIIWQYHLMCLRHYSRRNGLEMSRPASQG